MQCNEIRELLSSYIDEFIDPTDKVKLEEHIEKCSTCRKELAELQATVRLVRSLGELEPPKDFREKLLKRIEAERVVGEQTETVSASGRFMRIKAWCSANKRHIAAAAVIIGIGISMGLYQANQFDKHLAGGAVADLAQKEEELISTPNQSQTDTGAGQETKETTKNNELYDSTKVMEQPRKPAAQKDSLPASDTETSERSNKIAGQPRALVKPKAPAAADEAETMGILESQDQAANVQKIVKEASLTLEVQDYKDFSSSLPMLVEQHGGYIEDSSENMDEAVSASFVIRVPSDRFSVLMDAVEKLGKINGKQVTGSDVTGEYVDTEARSRNLKTQEARLLDLIDKASSLSDIVTLENELSRIRGEIETMEDRIKVLDDSVAYSTIRLQVSEVADSQLNPHQGVIENTIQNFQQSSVRMFNFFGSMLKLSGWLLPWVMMIGGTGGSVLYLVKHKDKKKD